MIAQETITLLITLLTEVLIMLFTYLSNMSHEIRTPINAVLGMNITQRLLRMMGSSLKVESGTKKNSPLPAPAFSLSMTTT
jgi:signal transduction histidine kinase